MKRRFGALLVLLLLVSAAGDLIASELPVEIFFRDFEFTDMKISPDGKYLVAIAPYKTRRNLIAIDMARRKPQWLTRFGDRHVYAFEWVSNERLILQMEEGGIDTGGLFAINRDASNDRVLVDTIRGQAQGVVTGLRMVAPLSSLAEDSESILVETTEIDKFSTAPSRSITHVDRMNVMTGRFKREAKNPGNIIHWVPDQRGKIRAAVAADNGRLKVLFRKDSESAWTTLSEYTIGEPGMWPLRFTAENKNLYVSAPNGHDTDGIYELDVEKKQLVSCLFHNERFDPGSLIVTPDNKEVLAVALEEEKPTVAWATSEWRMRQASVDRSLTNTINLFVNCNRDQTKIVYLASSDQTPGEFYLFDTTKQELESLARRATWIKPELMAKTTPISYKSRDELTIHGYLTLPPGGGTNLPLIVYPHGGPWARDTWGFDRETQFFANRGYAVLQMNFRGSTGYGYSLFRAGFKQWGLKMQDDVTDGLKWAIKEGIADKDRIGIYGASFGGFAVMTGLTQTPELYQCGVNYAGVTDLGSWLKGIRVRSSRSASVEAGYKQDAESLDAQSPLNHVEKILAPVFLAYGGQDPRVHIAQGRRLARALKSHNKKFVMVVEEQEGHGFHIEDNRVNLFKKIDAFLKENLSRR